MSYKFMGHSSQGRSFVVFFVIYVFHEKNRADARARFTRTRAHAKVGKDVTILSLVLGHYRTSGQTPIFKSQFPTPRITS